MISISPFTFVQYVQLYINQKVIQLSDTFQVMFASFRQGPQAYSYIDIAMNTCFTMLWVKCSREGFVNSWSADGLLLEDHFLCCIQLRKVQVSSELYWLFFHGYIIYRKVIFQVKLYLSVCAVLFHWYVNTEPSAGPW